MNPGAGNDHLVGVFRNYLYGNPSAPGVGSLVNSYAQHLGKDPNGFPTSPLPTFDPYTPPPTTPPVASPGAPGSPAAPGAGTPPGPINGPTPGSAPTQRPPGLKDIYDVYLSTVPLMNQERDQQISQAMAGAGFSGNRFGTAAMSTAGRIGAETALRQNQLLNTLLHQQNESDANRSLQAADLGLRQGALADQLERSRLDQLSGFGRWEQDRMDGFARLAYQDFESNKYGLLPMLMQFAASQSGGSAPTPYLIQQPGGTGAADWLTLLSGLLR